LTTIHIPRDQIGQLAFEALVSARSGGPAHGQEILIDPELIVRQSTGPRYSVRSDAQPRVHVEGSNP
jgi:DNA-binding LacI/PurR family transcriptional regulator